MQGVVSLNSFSYAVRTLRNAAVGARLSTVWPGAGRLARADKPDYPSVRIKSKKYVTSVKSGLAARRTNSLKL